MASDGERGRLIDPRGLLPLALLLAVAVALVILPLAVLVAPAVASAGGAAALGPLLADPLTRAALENSLLQGGISALCAGALGYPMGVLLGRYRFRGSGLLRGFLVVPFLLPSLVVITGFQELVGPDGALLGAGPFFAAVGRGVPGIVAVNVYFNAPMVALLTASAVEASPREQEEAAALLGASPRRVFRETWGPLSALGAGAGMLLTFLLAAMAFAAPLVVCGARCYTLEVRIWSLDQVLGQPGTAAVVALGALALLALPAVAYLVLLRRSARRIGRRTPPARPFPWRDRRLWPLAAYGVLFAAAWLVELGAVLARSVWTPGASAGAGWSVLLGPSVTERLGISTIGALGNSLLYASAATVLAMLLAVVTGYVRRRRAGTGLPLDLVIFTPVLVSPVLLAFGLATFWLPVLGGASASWLLIILSQATIAWPFAAQALRTGLERIDRAPAEAARVLGRPPFRAFLDVDLPRVRPALVTATMFGFAIGLGEFTATYFLVRPAFTTLPVELLRLGSLRLTGPAEALAGLLVLVSLASFALLSWAGERVEL